MKSSSKKQQVINIKLFIAIAILAVVMPIGLYIDNFGVGYWSNHTHWAELGSFFGGILTPILTFISIILILLQLRTMNKGLQVERDYRRNADGNSEIDYFLALTKSKLVTDKGLIKLSCINCDDENARLTPSQSDLAQLWNCIYIALMSLDKDGDYGPQHQKATIKISAVLGRETCAALDSYLRIASGNRRGGNFHF
ncbi:hypothetical protein [Shewanella waksmanii]|uniref:hypothetical protein n=1 Tax=Shewanella waksmanii TaxID=213783 RepID=UPI0012FADA05|nr:hypothetical protein [Shewanella waksmanii]